MNFCKLRKIVFALFLLSGQLIGSGSPFFRLPQDTTAMDTAAFVSAFTEENNRCFRCHGQEKYQYTNESLGTRVTELMCPNRIVRSGEFYRSNHKSFACTDCHSAEYDTFPHPGELRMESKYNCLDCHGGDNTYAQYHFEEIDAEYQKSVHFKLGEEGFTCWSCHDPHTYRITARTKDNIRETIAYDNDICLNCHSDFNRFQLLTEKAEINIIDKHDWLPNQSSHFASVRCIECHTRLNDSILIAHVIKPKSEAVRMCNECHSQNSILMASLYKFESREQRADGFFNGIILNESYVIGANRNEYLNILSLIIFIAVLGVIAVHTFFRIMKTRKLKEY